MKPHTAAGARNDNVNHISELKLIRIVDIVAVVAKERAHGCDGVFSLSEAFLGSVHR